MNYKIKPIPDEITAFVREKLVSPQYRSLPAFVSVADGYGPCRSCLQVFDQGNEERIYITYNPFEGISDLPDPGPVFVHHRECSPYNGDGFPSDLRQLPLLFESFDENCSLLSREPVNSPDAELQMEKILAEDQVSFINIRNAEVGCFVARVERA